MSEREIKFRAWIEKVWEDEDNKEYEMCYDLAFEDFEPINDLLGRVENLMQFTGLKDKNDVAIYEGAIVKGEDTDSNPPNHNFIGVVNFYNGAFEAKSKEDYNPDIWLPYWTSSNEADIEVIGNIHENPELLKESSDVK